MTGTTLSHYRIEDELGRGGMGVVYRAVDTRLDRTVAIKVLPRQLSGDSAARARFVQEAKTASALDHPSICTVHDIGEAEDGSTFMVMPFYDGVTIAARLLNGPIEPDETARIGAQIADGLAAAHAAGIVHRDIKPANVIMTSGGRVKILDFGVAKMAHGVALTREGSTVGTAYYMSPEQTRGEEATSRSDLWSLGVVLFEMVTGSRPFRGDYDAAAAYAIINEDPAPLPDGVAAPLAALIRSLLEKEPAARPASAAAVRDQLSGGTVFATTGTANTATAQNKAFQTSETETTTTAQTDTHVPPTGTSAANSAPSRPRWLAIALSALALVMAALAWVLWPLGGSPAKDGPVDAIAVFPFDVQAGDELAYLDRGMVSMLSPMIDGVGGMRSIDPKAVLGLYEQRRDRFIDPRNGRELAGKLGARRFILGSITRLGSRLQLAATLYGENADPISEDTQLVDSEEDLLAATNRLMIALVSPLLDGADSALDAGLLTTTESFPAMKAYVWAEELYRSGQFQRASVLADEAIGYDSTFVAALHLAANARAQFFGDSGTMRRAALRHVDKAPRRLQEAIRIRGDAVNVGGLETIERLKRFLERYPDDLDAMGYVADQTYHQYPAYGRPNAEAIPLFLRLLEFDPDNGEYIGHLAPLLYRERRFSGLDSLHERLRGVRDLPQKGALEILRFRANGDQTAFDSAAATFDFWEQLALLESHDVQAAQEYVEKAPPANASGFMDYLRLLSVELDAVRGQLGSRPAASARDSAQFLRNTLLVSGLNYLPLEADSAAILKSFLRRTAGQDEALEPLMANVPEERYPGDRADVGALERSLTAFRMGDAAWLREELAGLRARDGTAGTHWLGRNIRIEVEAMSLALDGKNEEALGVLDRITPTRRNDIRGANRWYDGSSARLLNARLLLAQGRHEDAIAWSRSVHEAIQGFAPIYLPETYLIEAEAYEALGRWGRAVDRYDRLLALWADAAPGMRPQVQEVARRRGQAAERMAEERR